MENSISYIIERKIENQKGGNIIVQADFRGQGSAPAINIALSRLVDKGKIRRLAHGIYYKPKKDPLFGEILPSPEEVAKAIARKERIRIRPAGIYALHKLGISTQVPTQLVYFTDGQRRKINIGNTQVRFKPTTARKMAMKGPLSSLVIQVLEELGTNNVSKNVKARLKHYLLKEDPNLLKRDLTFAPAHIHDFILRLLK